MESDAQDWQISLRKDLEEASLVVMLGIGNRLFGDDGAGIMVARALSRCQIPATRLRAFETGSAPENFTGSVKKLNPSHIIMIDAAEMKLRPGSIKKIKPDEIAYYSFSTHTLPLNLLAEYFKRDGYKVILLGIQPKNVSFGGALNPEVMESVRIIKEFFCEVLAINSLNCTYN